MDVRTCSHCNLVFGSVERTSTLLVLISPMIYKPHRTVLDHAVASKHIFRAIVLFVGARIRSMPIRAGCSGRNTLSTSSFH